MLKWCPEHGRERVLMADDVDYYRRCREVFIKPPEMPRTFNTPVRWGCPYDCGLCPDHEQHSCLSLIEITDHCNLQCPICYAASGPSRQQYRTLDHIQRMLDAVVRNEGEPDVVQISGGEPTLHPHFFAILDAPRPRPIRHLMVNTNGIRIAQDEAFAQAARRLHAGLRGLPAVRFVRARAADGAARRRSARRPHARARAAQRARHLHDAGRDAEEGPQRRRDRPDHRLRARSSPASAA